MTFISILHRLLMEEDHRGSIFWSRGSLYVTSPSDLASKILPLYFKTTTFKSFQKNLNKYGFRKLDGRGTRSGPCSFRHFSIKGSSVDSILDCRLMRRDDWHRVVRSITAPSGDFDESVFLDNFIVL